MPFFVNDEPAPADGRERLQSIVDRERYDQGTKCILCAACTTSCPSFWSNDEYVGPASIVQAHRFIFDSRDRAAAERLEVLNQQMGVWRCRTAFNCTNACPREIPDHAVDRRSKTSPRHRRDQSNPKTSEVAPTAKTSEVFLKRAFAISGRRE